ncbi:MAG: ribosome maturation factor RimP [Lewinella sp.]|nr:ribosome maturation factor RimP [Lewinella sp.]
MEEKINDLLEQLFSTEAFADCFLVDLELHKRKIAVFVDSDERMDFEKCRQISRYLENEYLDVAQPLGEEYTLEVSSPGVDRPLRFFRQYAKNIGRNLEVSTTEGTVYTGELLSVTPAEITMAAIIDPEAKPRHKGAALPTYEVTIAHAAIQQSIVKISF